ncbi:beta-ketoacyl synthase domain-containing protein [Cordyceps fumosorosea ARSEF 2679]|uniref:Beta-ketoacyl synthase domain-containing protein n=1 Tax=Cordyceps fumosorosea (strain ARSEF 2679) TaxID=1081104 RepID=A0A168E5K0_CORFA|nr:beta-ketoacyl synthase domain-containing protein [Cordyceps fumosorosea ARSEF 2679]OAA73401.1 beta-ketoacyl synthase domain-containing protein [Cordyceps fumosorosea ARSEF 2679]
MGRELFQYAVFRDTIAYLDRIVASVSASADRRCSYHWTIEEVLQDVEDDEDFVSTPEVAQTVCTALQIGIMDLLASWSIRPAAITGQSSGEMAAAYAAGRLTAAEAIISAFFHGQAVRTNGHDGALLAVGLGLRELEESGYMQGYEESVTVAATQSPAMLTMAGDVEAVEGLATKLTARNVFSRVIRTGGNAYHSRHMIAVGRKYQELVRPAMANAAAEELCEPAHRSDPVPWFSSVLPLKDMNNIPADADSYCANLELPVLFLEAVQQLVKTVPVNAMIEIGPHSALRVLISECLEHAKFAVPVMAALERNKDGQACLLKLAGNLVGMNLPVDLVAVNAANDWEGRGLPVHGCTAVDMPPYQYAYGPILYHKSDFSKGGSW